jgi:hypothetical protein
MFIDSSSPRKDRLFPHRYQSPRYWRSHRAFVAVDHITVRATVTLTYKLYLKEPPPSDSLAFSNMIASAWKASDGADVPITRITRARRSKKPKWETVLGRKWVNRSRRRYASTRIDLGRILEIQVVRTYRIVGTARSYSHEASTVLLLRKSVWMWRWRWILRK